MPYLKKSSYSSRPFYMLNPHWETVIPSILFQGPQLDYKRVRLELIDSDFIDIDRLSSNSKRCLIISHGLEGDSGRYYVKRTANYFHKKGWDVIAWNCRSCSGQMNRLPRFYHHGDTTDLSHVIDMAIAEEYDEIVLFGYSMGGSMCLKYAGEREINETIKAIITFSVPCNLRNSADVLKLKENQIYEKRFLSKLIEKMKLKSSLFPDVLKMDIIDSIVDFDDFHKKITAPIHGFKSAEAFFDYSTCDRYLSAIKVPAFIGNALNDPMLGQLCYPIEIARNSKYVFLETPELGGHVGFTISGKSYSWMEIRAEEFLRNHIKL